jgi:acetylornithine deacetylase
MGRAVSVHRGIQTATAQFHALSGHASEKRAFDDNAIHQAAQWMHAVLKWVKTYDESISNLYGLPFNFGLIKGGLKANMIASHCEINFGFRPLPGSHSMSILEAIGALPESKHVKIIPKFSGSCLPAPHHNMSIALLKSKQLIKKLGFPVGSGVDFWTEASLFSEKGMTAFVFGPGNIAQAHSPNEWVDVEQLKKVEKLYIDYLSQ